ncbi:MAG: O-methyltransferase [Alphaproteobacteria bacterium]|nr:O-methyltransferase [Alphaproteobacteria bacterium]
MKDDIFDSREDYIRALFGRETAAQKSARESLTGAHDGISLHAEEARTLQLLIRLGDIRMIVEIGTLGGYSALAMAAALPDDGRLWTLEKDPARAALARSNTAAEKRIKIIEGDARETLRTLESQAPFDMIFIDADKLNYAYYLDWAETHVRKGGLIVGDNTLLFDAVWMQERPPRVRDSALQAMRDFNRRLADPDKYLGTLLPTAEGMTIAQKLF